jgi:hypothetical protein
MLSLRAFSIMIKELHCTNSAAVDGLSGAEPFSPANNCLNSSLMSDNSLTKPGSTERKDEYRTDEKYSTEKI